jgi:hypothetical protein
MCLLATNIIVYQKRAKGGFKIFQFLFAFPLKRGNTSYVRRSRACSLKVCRAACGSSTILFAAGLAKAENHASR